MKFKSTLNIENISLRWGLVVFLLLSAYFIIMKSLGLIHVLELRAFNALIMFYGCFMTCLMTKNSLKDFSYLKGLGAGVLTAFISSSIFAAFGFLYLTVLNPGFMAELKANELFGRYLNEYMASLQIFIEGSASGILFTYASMQYLKVNRLQPAREIS